MLSSKSLTTKEVADLCRVSDATVKRWAVAGLLKSERTGGGHRRFLIEEVARFQREQKLGERQNFGDDSAIRNCVIKRSKQRNEDSLFQHLIDGRESAVADLLIKTFLHGEPLSEIFDAAVAAAMRRVGEMWFSGDLTVAQEHLATRTVLNAVQKLRAIVPIPQANGKLAMCFAVEDDYHELPVQFTQIVLESQGWEVLNFGANMPLYLFGGEVARQMPELVCIAATLINNLERTARDYQDFRRELDKLNVNIAIGGRAFADEAVRRRFPADLYASSFRQLADFAAKIAVRH